ncbi:MAG: cytochrome c-type biogenesis protein CcmH [SAR202 cluster bacterium]|jgi:cytochrome c-type biogenesis protein CcmH|nr:cytochrome c-type biogenesis protein CcmH [SAR202 cluster bacterium]MDP6714827.1 cytochrome c-type biogenesis protein CcmH [SAR202 cluster bacterium]
MNNPRFIIAFALAVIGLVALACTSITEDDVPEIERQTTALNKAIMCPVCPGESIDQSQNPLAVSMRAIVAERLADGWTGQQIKDFFVERYGPSVLMEPPREGISLAAWLLPPIAVVGAIFSVFLGLRWMRRTSAVPSAATSQGPVLTEDEQEDYFRRIETALDLDESPEDPSRPS